MRTSRDDILIVAPYNVQAFLLANLKFTHRGGAEDAEGDWANVLCRYRELAQVVDWSKKA